VLRLLIAAIGLSLGPSSTNSSFGPGQTYGSSSGGYDIGTVLNLSQVIAIPFMPAETVRLTDAVLALQQIDGHDPMKVYIESSSGGAPGSVLDTLNQVGSIKPFSPSLVDFTCLSCSVLDAGTMYFLVADYTQKNPLIGGQGDSAPRRA
jgi:hypothetical protein